MCVYVVQVSIHAKLQVLHSTMSCMYHKSYIIKWR